MGIGKMAHVDVASLSKTEKDELCCTYAALLLHDGGVEVTGEKIAKVIKASGNSVEGYWPGLFAKALQGQNIGALLTNVSGPAPAGGAAAATAGVAEKVEEAKKEEEPAEEEEEADMDMGGLFGDDEY